MYSGSKYPIVALQDYYAPEDFMIGLTVEILRWQSVFGIYHSWPTYSLLDLALSGFPNFLILYLLREGFK